MIALMVYVLYNTMEYIPNLASNMAGMTGFATMGANMPFTKELQAGMKPGSDALLGSKNVAEAMKAFGQGAASANSFADPIMRAMGQRSASVTPVGRPY